MVCETPVLHKDIFYDHELPKGLVVSFAFRCGSQRKYIPVHAHCSKLCIGPCTLIQDVCKS